MVHLQELRNLPESPQQVPRVTILKIIFVELVFVTILQETLYSYWRNVSNLQFTVSSSRSRFSESETLWNF